MGFRVRQHEADQNSEGEGQEQHEGLRHLDAGKKYLGLHIAGILENHYANQQKRQPYDDVFELSSSHQPKTNTLAGNWEWKSSAHCLYTRCHSL